MISCKLRGGLGNQMFQLAVAYAYAKKLDTECAFDFAGCHTPLQGHTSIKYKDNFFSNFNQLERVPENAMHWGEVSFKYMPLPLVDNKNVHLHGFFQSEKYFKEYKDEIITLFDNFDARRKHDILGFLFDIHEKSNRDRLIITVHVRRGDYITPPDKQQFHTNLADTTDYYQKAMKEFGNCDFIFVSDDIKWCEKNFKGKNIYYSPFKNEIDDLCLMSLAHGNIIANSSFSWWGAYLSRNEKVVAPKQWFGPTGPKDTQDVIPENWIKI